MNKTIVIGAVAVLVIVIAAAAYLLAGKNSGPYYGTTPYTTTISGSSTVASNPTSVTTAPTSVATSYTVEVGNSSTLGQYLENSAGFTLYTFGSDVAYSNASACYGSCATDWPPLHVGTLSLPPGLSSSSFSIITRTDASRQLAYNGHPLYLFIGDHNSGDISGQGVGGFSVATK